MRCAWWLCRCSREQAFYKAIRAVQPHMAGHILPAEESPHCKSSILLGDVPVWESRGSCSLGPGGKWHPIFFIPPPPSGGTPEKKAGTPYGIFFRLEEFFYCVLVELAWNPHFVTLYDIGT